MAQSFAGVPIFILADDVPRIVTPEISIRHIPSGDTTYVDYCGQQLKQITYTLLFPLGSDFIAFEALGGTVGALVTDFDGTFTAMLGPMRRASHGASAGGECVASCLFYIL